MGFTHSVTSRSSQASFIPETCHGGSVSRLRAGQDPRSVSYLGGGARAASGDVGTHTEWGLWELWPGRLHRARPPAAPAVLHKAPRSFTRHTLETPLFK